MYHFREIMAPDVRNNSTFFILTERMEKRKCDEVKTMANSNETASSLHKGHRQRLRARFLSEGLDGFTDVQTLELLLFYAIPRQDTNELAHRLLNHFGSLARVLDAYPSELERIGGVSTNTAALLNLAAQLSRRYSISGQSQGRIIRSTADYCRYLASYFIGRRDEMVFLLCMDAKNQVMCCREISRGSVNAAAVSVRKVVQTALTENAIQVVLAHNHPSGLAVPSADDIVTTRRVAMALDAVGVALVDHVVVADQDCVSMAASGLYDPESCRTVV